MWLKTIVPLLLLVSVDSYLAAQQISITGSFTRTGVVRSVGKGSITIETEGKSTTYKIQRKDERAVLLGEIPLRFPAEIKVHGVLNAISLEPGMVIDFETAMRRTGRCEEAIAKLTLAAADAKISGIELIAAGESGAADQCKVVGQIRSIKRDRVQLDVPKTDYFTRGRLNIELAEDLEVSVVRDDLDMVQAGDTVVAMTGVDVSTGDQLVQSIEIELAPQRAEQQLTHQDELQRKYQQFSDEPSPPRDLRSDHFVLHTDISDRSAHILLDKLETMYGLIASYYRKQPQAPIECFVVRDISQYPDNYFPADARAKILEPAGVTISQRLGRQAVAVVYSCDNHGVVQHEAVHAFCFLSFGSTGPVWYSEGMAEMGQYWQKGQLEVQIDPVVIGYLTSAEPKQMLEIVAAGQITGDSWKAYAWRWALCHLLANNPNYSDRFGALGVAMMSGKAASFESTYGDVAPHISFEYDQFVKNFGNGYRADLCAWDWSKKTSSLSGTRRATQKVSARAGWQTTSVQLKAGESYDIAAKETWKIVDGGDELTGDGDAAGNGKLIGAIFHDYQLSEPFEIGQLKTYVAASDGQLVLRCRDKWTELSDNDGELTVYVRRTPAEEN
jgi:hypothetical protein